MLCDEIIELESSDDDVFDADGVTRLPRSKDPKVYLCTNLVSSQKYQHSIHLLPAVKCELLYLDARSVFKVKLLILSGRGFHIKA